MNTMVTRSTTSRVARPTTSAVTGNGVSGGSTPDPPLGTITVTSDSLKFPDGNFIATATGAPAYLAEPANWAPSGQEIFDPAGGGCWMVMVEIPWETFTMTNTQRVGIAGNLGSGTANGAIGVNAARNTYEDDAFTIHFQARSIAGVNLTGSVNVTRDQRRLLLAIRMDSGQLRFEVYHEGTRIGVSSPTMGAWAATRLRSALIYGAQGSGTTGAFFTSGSFYGFNGSMAFAGFTTASVTQANLQNISNGVDPLMEITASTFRMYRRLTDTTATSLSARAAATGDATGSWTVTNTRSLTFRKGSSLTPTRSGSDWMQADYISDGRVFGRLHGATTGRIYLSGRYFGIKSDMQARVFDEDGQLTKDWMNVTETSDTGSAWAGYIDAPPNLGWGHIDVRAADDNTLISQIRARTGVGIVAAVLGQSQMYRCWTYTNIGTAVSGSAGALSTMHVTDRTATQHGLVLHPVTIERPRSDALAAVANALPQWTTEPVMLLNIANPGKGVDDLVTDADTDWNWSEVEASLTLATGPIANRRITAMAINWLSNFANDVGAVGNGIIGNHIEPLIEGTRDPSAITTFAIDHYIRDGLTFPTSMRIGLSIPTRYAATSAGPHDSSDTDTAANNHGEGRGQWISYAAGHSSIITATGPWCDDLRIEDAGGPHQDPDFDEGHPRTLRRVVECALRAAGVVTRTDPSLATASINGGRTAITITTNVPNSGTLQTAWSIKSVSVPVGETTVQGFEVQDGGAGSWTRSSFTAEISGSTVVLTKTSGSWAAGTKIRYLANGPLSYGTAEEANTLIHGLLYESGDDEGGLGLPLAGLYEATLA